MNKFKAEIIADSLNPYGARLTTFVITFPRIVLAEFNTHRAFSRNSASSRAIPFKTMVERCKTEPFIPLKFQKDHKGMQGDEYFEGPEHDEKVAEWLSARDSAVKEAEKLHKGGVTKQLCNRLLEPFMWHTVIVTASEWGNFFALRAHYAAEIHIQEIAYMMLEEYNKSNPMLLGFGEWHIPFGDSVDIDRLMETKQWKETTNGLAEVMLNDMQTYINDCKLKIATARCARISYNTFEGKDDYDADIELHDRLQNAGHMSPFEHCAKAVQYTNCNNFNGFKQYRMNFAGQNRQDARIKKNYKTENIKNE